MYLWTLLFASCMVVFGAIGFIYWRLENEKRRQRAVRGIVAGIEPVRLTAPPVVLVEPPKNRGRFGRWFKPASSPADAGDATVWSEGGLLMLTVGMTAAGFLFGMRLSSVIGPAAPVMGAAALGVIPWRRRSARRKKRLLAIETQFPDALDFLARSVRAGNAFSVGLELLASEVADPLRTEILKLTREMALGAPFDEAMNGLIRRVPLVEVRFFVAAVQLQRETGGNLNEVLGKLSISVRERLRLRGQVKAAGGQARLTALVLTVLPIATLILLKLLSPGYVDAMTNDPTGRNLLAAAAVSQTFGYLVMKKIAHIEV